MVSQNKIVTLFTCNKLIQTKKEIHNKNSNKRGVSNLLLQKVKSLQMSSPPREVPLVTTALTQGGETPLRSARTCPAVAMRHLSCYHGLFPYVQWQSSACHAAGASLLLGLQPARRREEAGGTGGSAALLHAARWDFDEESKRKRGGRREACLAVVLKLSRGEEGKLSGRLFIFLKNNQENCRK